MKQPIITALGALVALLETLSAPALAVAGDGLKAKLRGFEEVAAGSGSVSTQASGTFRGEINNHGTEIDFELTYAGLEGTVQQGHIHVARRGVAGGISVWLCQTAPSFIDPAGLAKTCPPSGKVEGTITAANVIGPRGQGIDPGEFAELVRAIRAGVTYANVHSTKFPTGEIRGQIQAEDSD
jgi:CHRD domain-containing protein